MFSNGEEKKLDWMYKGPNALVDRESYLLGRAVDKTLEGLNREEAAQGSDKVIAAPKNHVEHECIPPSIRDYNKIVKSEQVDLQAKLQEDPLVLIKRQEDETRRQFLQNPVQLKKLQDAIESQMKNKNKKTKDTKKDKKFKKKLKKLNKQLGKKQGYKELEICSDDDEAILDTILMHKFNSLKNELSEEDLKNILLGNSSESEDTDDDESKATKRKVQKHLSDSECDERQKGKSVRSSKKQNSYTPERNKNIKESSNIKERYKTILNKEKLSTNKKRITDQEKEALRKSMMEHAAIRNAESAKNFKKYKEEHSKPEIIKEHDKNFVRNQLLKAANVNSVADRIKANVNNIQRSKFAMDTNFLK